MMFPSACVSPPTLDGMFVMEMPCPALPSAAVPAAFVPMRLPIGRFSTVICCLIFVVERPTLTKKFEFRGIGRLISDLARLERFVVWREMLGKKAEFRGIKLLFEPDDLA